MSSPELFSIIGGPLQEHTLPIQMHVNGRQDGRVYSDSSSSLSSALQREDSIVLKLVSAYEEKVRSIQEEASRSSAASTPRSPKLLSPRIISPIAGAGSPRFCDSIFSPRIQKVSAVRNSIEHKVETHQMQIEMNTSFVMPVFNLLHDTSSQQLKSVQQSQNLSFNTSAMHVDFLEVERQSGELNTSVENSHKENSVFSERSTMHLQEENLPAKNTSSRKYSSPPLLEANSHYEMHSITGDSNTRSHRSVSFNVSPLRFLSFGSQENIFSLRKKTVVPHLNIGQIAAHCDAMGSQAHALSSSSREETAHSDRGELNSKRKLSSRRRKVIEQGEEAVEVRFSTARLLENLKVASPKKSNKNPHNKRLQELDQWTYKIKAIARKNEQQDNKKLNCNKKQKLFYITDASLLGDTLKNSQSKRAFNEYLRVVESSMKVKFYFYERKTNSLLAILRDSTNASELHDDASETAQLSEFLERALECQWTKNIIKKDKDLFNRTINLLFSLLFRDSIRDLEKVYKFICKHEQILENMIEELSVEQSKYIESLKVGSLEQLLFVIKQQPLEMIKTYMGADVDAVNEDELWLFLSERAVRNQVCHFTAPIFYETQTALNHLKKAFNDLQEQIDLFKNNGTLFFEHFDWEEHVSYNDVSNVEKSHPNSGANFINDLKYRAKKAVKDGDPETLCNIFNQCFATKLGMYRSNFQDLLKQTISRYMKVHLETMKADSPKTEENEKVTYLNPKIEEYQKKIDLLQTQMFSSEKNTKWTEVSKLLKEITC